MTSESYLQETVEPERLETDEGLGGEPGVSRREFVELLGGGLLLTVSGDIAFGQRRGFGGFGASGPANIATRLHLGNDGTMTVMTGKVELGQGARAELTQAAAEELRVAADQVRLIMADTGLVPNDGITAGSQTTPRIVPVVRRAAAAARELLVGLACKQWRADRGAVEVKDGVITHAATKRTMSYADLARAENVAKTLAQAVLGTSLARPNGRDIVTGAHRYPSDIVRPGMLYGKALRAPSYGATLTAIDLAPAKAMEGVVVVRDGAFVGCAALTLFQAKQAVEAIAKTATWKTSPHPSSRELFSYLRKQRRQGPIWSRRRFSREGDCRRREGPSPELRNRLHPARADGAPGGRGRVE
jgi:isoquinoline 1-oxidoreductase beta subunit